MATLDFGGNNAYLKLDCWVLANVVQLATQDFCERFLDLRNDPKGRQFDQMTQAARSGVANIAEGSARTGTSVETALKLLDVSRASFAELSGDYANWLLHNRSEPPWPRRGAEAMAVYGVRLGEWKYGDDWQHDAYRRVLAEREKFKPWTGHADGAVAANAVLVLIARVQTMLRRQLDAIGENFSREGGFSERLTKARLETRDRQAAAEGAPKCPECGAVMRLRVAKRGGNAGNRFWSCPNWPDCKGTRPFAPR